MSVKNELDILFNKILNINANNNTIESEPSDDESEETKAVDSLQKELDFELKHCIKNCKYTNCCDEECCSKSEKERAILYHTLEKEQYKNLSQGDTVYDQLRSGLSCGIRKPKNIQNLTIVSQKKPATIILSQSKYVIDSNGIRFNLDPEQIKSVCNISTKLKDFNNTTFILLKSINIDIVNLENWPSDLVFLVTLRMDKPKFKIFANQETYHFNDKTGNKTNTNKYYGTVVYSNKLNNYKGIVNDSSSSSSSSSNTVCSSSKRNRKSNNDNDDDNNNNNNGGYRKCVIDRCIDWWNGPPLVFTSHPDDPEITVCKIQNEDEPGYANSLEAYWLIKFYLPAKKKELIEKYKELNKTTNTYDKDVVNAEYYELIQHYQGQLIDLDPNYEDYDQDDETLDEEQLIKKQFIKNNHLQFVTSDVLKTWNDYQEVNNQISPFVNYKDGMYLYFEALDKKEFNKVQSQFNNSYNSSNKYNNLGQLKYSIEFSIGVDSILQFNHQQHHHQT